MTGQVEGAQRGFQKLLASVFECFLISMPDNTP